MVEPTSTDANARWVWLIEREAATAERCVRCRAHDPLHFALRARLRSRILCMTCSRSLASASETPGAAAGGVDVLVEFRPTSSRSDGAFP